VSKRAGSLYRNGNAQQWLKCKKPGVHEDVTHASYALHDRPRFVCSCLTPIEIVTQDSPA
jgi:hypothetical protein